MISDDPHASIGLIEKEVNTIINGMDLILNMNETDELSLSDNAKFWYTHVKNLFEAFKKYNY